MPGLGLSTAIRPNATANDLAGVYALLAVISDPKQAKTELDRLVAAKAAADEAISKAEQMQVAASNANQTGNRIKAEADRAAGEVAEARRKQMEQAALVDAKQAEQAAALAQFKSSLDVREKNLKANEATLQSEAQKQTAALSKREAAVAEREKTAEQLVSDAEALKAQYEAKIAEIRRVAA